MCLGSDVPLNVAVGGALAAARGGKLAVRVSEVATAPVAEIGRGSAGGGADAVVGAGEVDGEGDGDVEVVGVMVWVTAGGFRKRGGVERAVEGGVVKAGGVDRCGGVERGGGVVSCGGGVDSCGGVAAATGAIKGVFSVFSASLLEFILCNQPIYSNNFFKRYVHISSL